MAMASSSEVNLVYNKLLDFFPQVDPRILKAVAIENRSNIDEAFCVVIDEILPHNPELNCLTEDVSSQPLSGLEAPGLKNPWTGPELQLVQEAGAVPSSTSELPPEHDGISVTPMSELGAKKFLDEVTKINNTDKLISFGKGLAHHLNVVPVSSITSVHEQLEGEYETGSSSRGESYSSLIANEELVLPPTIGSTSVLPEVTELAPCKGKCSKEALDSEPDTESYMAVSGDEHAEPSGMPDSGLQKDETDGDWFDASVHANGLLAQPSPTINIELLESSIEQAKNSKKTLFSSMEAVMDAMKEAEIREKAVENARLEAERGVTEILSRAEELKTMLHKAKEANDMHAGEVYGERSILATEAAELQSRLANLTEERDEALCILEEMRYSLEIRRLAADEEIRKLEKEKLQKENDAKMLLDDQEEVMSKLVQESKLLRLEAEENSKLREFLVDRGQIVDALHGEIGVICQDVKSLKAKFDKHIPLSESFSSGETACILASSSSSSKRGLSSLVVSDQDVSSESGSPAKSPTELDGDGWEFLIPNTTFLSQPACMEL